MKRATYRIVLFLLLGAIINVAVAWGCAAWSTRPPDQSPEDFFPTLKYWGEFDADRTLLESLGWNGREETPDAEYILFAMASAAPGLVYRELAESSRSKDPNFEGYVISTDVAYETLAGWPYLALRGVRWNQAQRGEPDRWVDHMLIETPLQADILSGRDSRSLPFRPTWPGFAINTILYAFLGWLLVSALFQLRRSIRRKHGACIKCRYDLRHAEHAVCPECGATP